MRRSPNRSQVRKAPTLAAAAIALGVLAQSSAAYARDDYAGPSLGVYGSANAVEHRLLRGLGPSFGLYGSSNAVEHRLISHLGDARDPSGRFNTPWYSLAR